MTTIKIIFRIIASPFWLTLFLIAAMKQVITQMVYFFKYGGEMISYWKKDQTKMITSVYNKLEQLIDKETSNNKENELKNKDRFPIYYKNADEMDKPLSALMEELRGDLSKIRGKLFDIKQSYGWADRIEHIEGGITCLLVAMYDTMKEWEKHENKELTTK